VHGNSAEYLAKLGMIADGETYLDGRKGQKVGITLESPDPVYGKVQISRSWIDDIPSI
jgi:hypothetical protein